MNLGLGALGILLSLFSLRCTATRSSYGVPESPIWSRILSYDKGITFDTSAVDAAGPGDALPGAVLSYGSCTAIVTLI